MDDSKIKIVYFFLSYGFGIDKLIYYILPELEQGVHKIKVLGMCFFDDNANILSPSEPVGKRLGKLSHEQNIVLMIAELKDLDKKSTAFGKTKRERINPTQCTVITVVNGQQVGCFPDVYAALGNNSPDHFISL